MSAKRTTLLVTGALACAGGWSAWRTSARPAAPAVRAADTVSIAHGRLELRLTLVGELRPTDSQTVTSQVGGDRGTIIEIIEDGTLVEEGRVLARLDPSPFEEAVETAQLDVLLAQGRLQVAQHAEEWEKTQSARKLRTAEFERDLAALDLHRFEKGEGPLEQARLEADLNEAESEAAQQGVLVTELSALLEMGHIQEAEIEQLRSRAEKAQRTVELARKQSETYSKFILPTRKSALRLAKEKAEVDLEEVRRSSASKVGEAAAALQLARGELEAARGRLAEAELELERTVVRAPGSGLVVLAESFRDGERRKPRVGDSVWQNQPIAFLPDLARFEVAAQIREVDVHKVAPGSRGVARFDAYPELEIEATVRSIGVLAQRVGQAQGQKFFQLVVDLDGTDERLRPGMTGRVEVRSSQAEDVLLIPLQAVWERGREAWCWIQEGDVLERRMLELGLRNHHSAEVLGGLAAGEVVSLVGPAD